MKKLDFGKTKSMAEKVAMATKKGYDTGAKSKDAPGATKPKLKPKLSKSGGGTIGIKMTMKTGKRK